MRSDVTFQQRCPVCGRAVQVSVVLLGRRVYCQHCGGGFTAMDETMRLRAPRDGAMSLDAVERLLARASLTLERSSPANESEWRRTDEASIGGSRHA